MPKPSKQTRFEGFHWETGSVRNYYACRGVAAPHSGQPFSEALLMGVSGGAVMGYFSFAYEGYDPHVAILTRNTFDPMQTMLERLGVEQTILQTTNPQKGLKNLLDTLEDGSPALVWADMYTLPYNALPHDAGMWQVAPMLVYGYEREADRVWIADRAEVPLTATMDELAAARSRIDKFRFRVVTLDLPDPDKLPAAITEGIRACVALFTETPPKGSKHNFGFAAYQRWAELLVRPKQRLSWDKEFPPGGKLYAGLTSTFNSAALFGQNGIDLDAERKLYAAFLDEAAAILDNRRLGQAAAHFRRSSEAWSRLAHALLPDEIGPLAETRGLMIRRQRAFIEQGNGALAEMREIDARLAQLKAEVAADFPLDRAGVDALQERLRDHVLQIHDIERAAVELLEEAMA